MIKLSRFLRRHERELEWYKEALRLGYPGAQYQKMNPASLMQTVKLAQSLISQGFDEVLVTKFFDDLGDEPGWLPVRGGDFIRLVKAFGEAVAAPHTDMWMNNLTPYIRLLEGQVYAEWPTWMGPELMSPYHRALIRLDDAEEGEKFTDRLLLERPGEEDAANLQIPTEKVVRWFRRVSLRDYLELAAAVNGYAVSVYRRAGYPLQMLSPVLPPNTLGVYLSRQGRPHATPLGYIVPYDARFKEVVRAFKPREWYVPASRRRVAIVKMQAFGTRVGEGLYRIEGAEALAALEEVVGDEYPLLVKSASLCGEGLYLWLWFEGERPRYRRIQPPEELFPTMLAALSCAFPSRLLGKAWGEGPERLLTFRRMSITLGDRRAIYHIATEPKEWRGGRIYLDIETGSGFALPEEYIP